MTIQNNEAVYDDQIAPLMSQIIAIRKKPEIALHREVTL